MAAGVMEMLHMGVINLEIVQDSYMLLKNVEMTNQNPSAALEEPMKKCNSRQFN